MREGWKILCLKLLDAIIEDFLLCGRKKYSLWPGCWEDSVHELVELICVLNLLQWPTSQTGYCTSAGSVSIVILSPTSTCSPVPLRCSPTLNQGPCDPLNGTSLPFPIPGYGQLVIQLSLLPCPPSETNAYNPHLSCSQSGILQKAFQVTFVHRGLWSLKLLISWDLNTQQSLVFTQNGENSQKNTE